TPLGCRAGASTPPRRYLRTELPGTSPGPTAGNGLSSKTPLDTGAWLKANEAMQSALDGIDEAAWTIKFERLFEDQE
ncbi:MAG: hypothetical protein ABFE08_01855, partial [Armatimonadia bacterium]